MGVPGANHEYDDGYVRVDASGNQGGRTWNWGYEHPESLAGSTLNLQRVNSPTAGGAGQSAEEPQYGFELAYDRAFREIEIGGTPCLVGVHVAFATTFLDLSSRRSFSGRTTGVRDSYDLSGLPAIPGAPYFGGPPQANGPLPLLIPDSPSARTPIDLPATGSAVGKVAGNLYGFRVGPFFETPWNAALRFQLSAGFAAVLADGEFSFSESLNGAPPIAGAVNQTQWRFGAYAEGRVTVSLNDHWRLFATGGYQNVDDFSLSSGAQTAKVKLGAGIFTTAGVGYSF